MKTIKLSIASLTLGLIFFMSTNGISNSSTLSSGDVVKAKTNKIQTEVKDAFSNANKDNEFSYLRFDVNKFIDNSEMAEISMNTFNNLRFDVTKFTTVSGSEITELPLQNEFEYLRFDVNNFTNTISQEENIEMPANSLDYLKFNVDDFTSQNSGVIDELPLTK